MMSLAKVFSMLMLAGMKSAYGQELNVGGFDIMGFLSTLKLEGPIPCPSDPNVTGYDNITQFLVDLVLTNLVEPMPGTYTICPHTNYTFREELSLYGEDNLPVLIPFDNITINCGENGALENNCIFMDGYVHVILASTNSEMNGFTFMGSKGLSVVAVGPATNQATFNNCVWKENDAWFISFSQFLFNNIMEAITDYERLSGMIPTSILDLQGGLPPVTDEGMTLNYNDCHFHNNQVQVSLLLSNYTTTNVNRGKFSDNEAKYSDIIYRSGSKGTITDSCFVHEGLDQYLGGSIFIDETSTLVQSNNYINLLNACIVNNIGTTLDCLTYSQHFYGDNSAACMDYNCQMYTATSCQADATIPPTEASTGTTMTEAPVTPPTEPDTLAPVASPIADDPDEITLDSLESPPDSDGSSDAFSVNKSYLFSVTKQICFYLLFAIGWFAV